ncbi:hypothetical protein [Paraburkholderia hospita]|uniref:hypothetical protein n=1 Tax=Paraburkholderia hospita TaxID=169430 RepID=UPI003ECD43A5
MAGGDERDVERAAPLDNDTCAAAYRARHPDRNRASSRAWRERNLEHVLVKQAEYRARRRADATAESMPIEPVESCSQNPVLAAKEIAVSESVLEYFEIPEMPGRRFFRCEPLRASMHTESCGERWALAQGQTEGRYLSCKRCPIGAAHAGKVDQNLSPFKGLMCARCHRTNGRLIGRFTCVSCFNRSREWVRKKNAKGTLPFHHPPLHRMAISYRASGEMRTRVFDLVAETTELMVAVLRDESSSVAFAYRAPASLDWLLDGDVYDRAIGDAVEVADVAAPVPAALDVVQADPIEDVEADPYNALRDAPERADLDAPVSMPRMSRRAAKRQRQQRGRQVRVSPVLVALMQKVAALPAAPPVPVPAPQPSYSAALMSGGAAFG